MHRLSRLHDIQGMKVLVRVDFNVPVKDNKISDDYRIEASKPTIEKLLEGGAKIALVSHISDTDHFEPIAGQISQKLDRDVTYAGDAIGKAAADILDSHDIVLLDNVRVHDGEEKNDDAFAAQLAEGFDLYVNDAFATAHRAHASLEAVTKHLPSYAGLLIEREVRQLADAIEAPQVGKTLILGGAKISTKLPVIKNFVDRAEQILIGGALANNFLAFEGHEVGKSLVDTGDVKLVHEIDYAVLNLPKDYYVSKSMDGANPAEVKFADRFSPDDINVDIGPETASHFAEIIRQSKMVIWNGPMGLSEVEAFSKGTRVIAQAVAECQYSLIGGGDSIATIREMGLLDKMKHISTGGGAMLAFLGNVELPALKALDYYN